MERLRKIDFGLFRPNLSVARMKFNERDATRSDVLLFDAHSHYLIDIY